ncbi:lipoprotein-releasing system permease protein [Taibaiella chishuiensis]|uniref:Lipoprotein-releasing system permease protein n=1 Tax=Taibaiella chishuiensis TaxID=1434707 RepID=A0A2P8D4G8_9BACT|nr:lipoprotein-releasing system permease protein [Taibaiella chishuiensis]
MALKGYFCPFSKHRTSSLNLPFFIARRIASNRKASFSRFITRLATMATTLSVAIMIVAVAVVFGFKETIKDKMFVFWGHIQVAPYNPNPASIIAPIPIPYDAALAAQIKAVPGVTRVYPFAVKPVILNANGLMEGLKLKGVDPSYSWQGNEAISFSGKPVNFSDSAYAQQIVLSQSTLEKMNLKTGDSLLAYFVDPEQEFPRVRKLQICGTYHTGMEEIDRNFALCDIQLLRRISNWEGNAINGYQVAVRDYTTAGRIADDIYRRYLEPPMSRTTMQELYPNIFNWLGLMNTNAYIILAIMAVVAVINMATALLIFIMERTNMIGTLKALGMASGAMQKIFVYHALQVALQGILLGTLLGVGICLLQQYTHFISLDESSYYMSYAPVKLVSWHVLLIDLAALIFFALVMLLPSLMVRGINIVKALRFK